jgi:hypothetical protein
MRSIFKLINDIFQSERLLLDKYPFLNLKTKNVILKTLQIFTNFETFLVKKVDFKDVIINLPIQINDNILFYPNTLSEVQIEYTNPSSLKVQKIFIISQNQDVILKQIFINNNLDINKQNISFSGLILYENLTNFFSLKMILDISVNHQLIFPDIYIIFSD